MELDRPKDALAAISPLKPASPEYATAMFLKHVLGATETSNASPEKQKSNAPETPNQETSKRMEPAIAEKPAALTIPE
jgi:hypothetical protein